MKGSCHRWAISDVIIFCSKMPSLIVEGWHPTCKAKTMNVSHKTWNICCNSNSNSNSLKGPRHLRASGISEVSGVWDISDVSSVSVLSEVSWVSLVTGVSSVTGMAQVWMVLRHMWLLRCLRHLRPLRHTRSLWYIRPPRQKNPSNAFAHWPCWLLYGDLGSTAVNWIYHAIPTAVQYA